MPEFECNACGNRWEEITDAFLGCPSCGSGDVTKHTPFNSERKSTSSTTTAAGSSQSDPEWGAWKYSMLGLLIFIGINAVLGPYTPVGGDMFLPHPGAGDSLLLLPFSVLFWGFGLLTFLGSVLFLLE